MSHATDFVVYFITLSQPFAINSGYLGSNCGIVRINHTIFAALSPWIDTFVGRVFVHANFSSWIGVERMEVWHDRNPVLEQT